MIDFYYHLKIKALLALNPAVLFDRINHLAWYKNTLTQWTDDLTLPKEGSILEAGCSTGLLSQYLHELSFDVVGIDKSVAMISKARVSFPHLSFREENIFDLSFNDNYFDAVIAASLINIVSDKVKALKEMVRVCKQGGKVSVFVPVTGFSMSDLDKLCDDLKVTNFSKAALQTWYKLPPKMDKQSIDPIFAEAGLSQPNMKFYLNGMVAQFTGIKR